MLQPSSSAAGGRTLRAMRLLLRDFLDAEIGPGTGSAGHG